MSDATGAAEDGTPDETFGRFEDDPILGELFVPIGDPPGGGTSAEADAADTDEADDAAANGADADAADADADHAAE